MLSRGDELRLRSRRNRGGQEPLPRGFATRQFHFVSSDTRTRPGYASAPMPNQRTPAYVIGTVAGSPARQFPVESYLITYSIERATAVGDVDRAVDHVDAHPLPVAGVLDDERPCPATPRPAGPELAQLMGRLERSRCSRQRSTHRTWRSRWCWCRQPASHR